MMNEKNEPYTDLLDQHQLQYYFCDLTLKKTTVNNHKKVKAKSNKIK